MPKRSLQITQKEEQPFAKKKKPNEDSELNVPIVTSGDKLLGKKAQNITYDYNGEKKLFLVLWFVENKILIPSS